ncbi:hypothetical protein M3O96_14500 [Aquiflexum sp. TKW24L]|uniref:hypothetical protein n=1 Tax=Aquiflexum sp. TKW24L TaxID=2942212 RepID=UPI0020BEB0F6|nr:hypothetical protein [Aquiflexum sp. TKW24L]MCL6260309.1 hypothetical protein [Aquiflexum sp. TKW24L]
MKLSKPQIEKINQSIKMGIYYQDIRSELVDHLASAIEQEMGDGEISFELALDQQLAKLNLDKFQRQILLSHHSSAFKKLFAGWLNPENFGLALLAFCVTYFLIHIGSIEASHTYSTFLLVMITVNTAPFFYRLFTKPMRNSSEFMSVINSMFLLYMCMSFSFDLLLEFSPIPKQIFMPAFMGILAGQLIIGIRLVSNTYEKLKLAKQ